MTVVAQLSASTPTRRLGTFGARVQEVGYPSAEPLSVYLGRGVVRRSEQTDNHNALGGDLAKYQRVLPGDLVFNRLRTWQGGFGASRFEGIVSPAYIVMRPVGADAGYLNYVLQSAPYLAELIRISKWMPPSQFDVLWTDLRNVEVPDMPLEAQRRIADFLDDRVARIDRIIAARHQQFRLIRDDTDARLDMCLQATDVGRTRLGRLASVQTGITVDSGRSHAGAESWPYLRVANVQADHLDLSEVKEVAVSRDAAARAMLQPGDVLMTEGGDLDKLGRGTLWSGEIDRCLHQNHVFAVRPDRDRLDPEFLALYTGTSEARRYFESTGVRSTNLASTSSTKVRDLPLPILSLQQQQGAACEASAVLSRAAAAQRLLHEQVAVLVEYKQSLITAAVTGELDVSTAGSGIPG